MPACIQSPGDTEPTYLKGNVCISRNPVVHPGDCELYFTFIFLDPDKGHSSTARLRDRETATR